MRRTAITALLLLSMLQCCSMTSAATPIDTQRVAFIGDSITTGYGVPTTQSWAYRLEARQAGDNVLPLGVNGATTRRWLQQYLPQLDQLRTWQPVTVVIALGGNEWHMTRPALEYADHLRQLIDYVHQMLPGARILLLHYYEIIAVHEPTGCDAPPGDTTPCTHAQPPDSWETYGTVLRDTAQRNRAGYLDISRTRNWAPYQFDNAHLNAEGHRLYEMDLRAALTSVP